MKLPRQFCGGLLALALAASAFGQGSFQNLGFESPVGSLDSISIFPGDPAIVPFANAFPGWIGYVGTNQATLVRIDNNDLDIATLGLIRSNSFSAYFAPLIEGSYTAVLQPQVDPKDASHSSLVPVSLAQTSLVPVDSRSLLFKGYTGRVPFTVSLGGVNIPVFAVETFPSYTLYGGDISAFAGSIAELRFTAFPDNYPHSSVFALDSIAFSPQAIPEPGVFSTVGLGALFLGWRLSRKVKS